MLLHNQRGYALILVLITITIISIAIPTLAGGIINSAQQNNIIEENKQLTKISEMGMTYFRKYKNNLELEQRMELKNQLKAFVQNKTPIWNEQLSQGFTSEEDIRQEVLNKKRAVIKNFEAQLNNCFTTNVNQAEIQCFKTIKRPQSALFEKNDTFQFSFQDISVSSGDFYIDLEYTSIATKKENNAFEQTKPEWLRIEFGDINVPINIKEENNEDGNPEYNSNCPTSGTYIGNCIYNNDVVIQGNLTIKGKVKFMKSLTLTSGSRVWIYGDTNIEGLFNSHSGSRMFIQGQDGKEIDVCFKGGNIHSGARVYVNNNRITAPQGCS